MKIIARELAAALAACNQVVDASGKIPILKCVRLSADNGTLTATATNTEQTVQARAACEGDMTICVDAAILAAKVATLKPTDPVAFDLDDRSVTISQGRTRWKMPVLLDDFPVMVASPVGGDAVEFGREFIAAVKQAMGNVNNGAPGALGGLWLAGDHILGVDNKSFRVIQMPYGVGTAILPVSSLAKLVAMFADGGRLACNDQAASFSRDGMMFKTRLLDAKQSDWRASIERFEKLARNSLTVDAAEFQDAIRRASAIRASGDKAGAFINMQLRIRADEIEVATRNIEGEEGNDGARIERDGEDADIGMNGGALMAALQSLPADTLRIRYGGNSDIMLIEPLAFELRNLRAIAPRMFS